MKKLLLLLIFYPFAGFTQNLFDGAPVFHGAQVTGNYPGTDFLFTVPATGERPITFSVKNLPKGLMIDAATGIINGKVDVAGEYVVTVTATNKKGMTEEELKIVIGETLCLTPPMGWNSWNVFTKYIDEKMLMEIADAMVSTGMRDLGYQYINIDDYWHDSTRAADGKPVADPAKFPHGIKYVSDYIHSKGLKLGIYSDAGTKTCGKCFGGFQHEEIDANVYAEWGVDLLKYDYCFTPVKKKVALERYTKMGTALRNSGRSIVYSICNWGLFAPWKWGAEAGGNYWRTTPDIFDTWSYGSVWRYSFMHILKKQRGLEKYAGPGHWNDPDMLTVGNYGMGKATSANGKFKGMTDTEYQTEMSLWCLLNAPLLSSCDLRKMNEITLKILTNAEIIAINQDALGEQATLVNKSSGIYTYMKHLKDGSIVAGVFNSSSKEKTVELKLSTLGIEGIWHARDVWQHNEAGVLGIGTKKGETGELIIPGDIPLTLKSHQTVVLKLEAQSKFREKF